MRKKGILKILLVLVVSVLLAYIAYFGFNVQNKQLIDTNTGINNMRMGLDIKGGVRLVYSPEGVQATTEDLNKALRVIRKRLDTYHDVTAKLKPYYEAQGKLVTAYGKEKLEETIAEVDAAMSKIPIISRPQVPC